MIRRIAAISVALTLGSFVAAQADDIGGESIMIPPPAAVERVVERTIVEEPVTAPPPPFVSLESTTIAAGIGFSWGEGILSFEGQRHAFSVKGLSLGDLGFAAQISEGAVANLNELSDFAGTYVAVEAGAAAGVGASRLSMRNQNGVVIHLRSDVSGAQLAIGPEGLRITLD